MTGPRLPSAVRRRRPWGGRPPMGVGGLWGGPAGGWGPCSRGGWGQAVRKEKMPPLAHPGRLPAAPAHLQEAAPTEGLLWAGQPRRWRRCVGAEGGHFFFPENFGFPSPPASGMPPGSVPVLSGGVWSRAGPQGAGEEGVPATGLEGSQFQHEIQPGLPPCHAWQASGAAAAVGPCELPLASSVCAEGCGRALGCRGGKVRERKNGTCTGPSPTRPALNSGKEKMRKEKMGPWRLSGARPRQRPAQAKSRWAGP